MYAFISVTDWDFRMTRQNKMPNKRQQSFVFFSYSDWFINRFECVNEWVSEYVCMLLLYWWVFCALEHKIFIIMFSRALWRSKHFTTWLVLISIFFCSYAIVLQRDVCERSSNCNQRKAKIEATRIIRFHTHETQNMCTLSFSSIALFVLFRTVTVRRILAEFHILYRMMFWYRILFMPTHF